MMWRGCVDKEWCWWSVRVWVDNRIVHRSMTNDSRVADEAYRERLFGVGGFTSLLSLLVTFYSKASKTLNQF